MSSSSSIPIQSISITKVTSDPKPTPHLIYHIQISLPVKSWNITKRYSDFIHLDSKLHLIQSPLPSNLPPKHSTKNLLHSVSTLGGWIPGSRSSGFLDLDSKDQDQIQLMRERKSGLEAYLRALLSSNDGVWRESNHFKAFLQVGENLKLEENGTKDRQPPSEAVRRMAQRQQQQSQPQSQSLSNTNTSTSTSTPFVRTLGKPQQYQETDQTRHLDDGGLFQSQKDQFDQQDAQLDSLAQILRRQKQLGLTMNQELAEQNELLATLDAEVDVTQGKMKVAEGKMSRLENK